MKKLLISSIVILLLGSALASLGQKKSGVDVRIKSKEQLIQDFISSDWGPKVVPAKRELESRQGLVLEDIIRLLDKDEKVKLKNTFDLIYPGAEKFYGHGWILDYDVDWISVRAGWLLEELTFQDFGFRQGVISEADIMMTVVKGKSGTYVQDLQGKLKEQDAQKQARIVAVGKAKDWWKAVKKPWARLDALLEALKSTSLTRQNDAVHWLRFGETKCDGLTQDVYEKVVIPETERVRKSADESLREQIDEIPDWNLFSRIHEKK